MVIINVFYFLRFPDLHSRIVVMEANMNGNLKWYLTADGLATFSYATSLLTNLTLAHFLNGIFPTLQARFLLMPILYQSLEWGWERNLWRLCLYTVTRFLRSFIW